MDLRERIRRLHAAQPSPDDRAVRVGTAGVPADIYWIAEETGWSWRTVYDWCSGRARPRPAFLRLIEQMEREAGLAA